MFGSLRSKDQQLLTRIVKQASRIICAEQAHPDILYKNLVLKKINSILTDYTHPLFNKFVKSNRSNRILQCKIKTNRYGKSFVPSAIRFYNVLV